jgi:cytochrome b pre-mRNA-processing protein 3
VVQRIRANPVAFKIVRALSRALGYGSTKQVAGRRTLAMYEQVCAIKASEDRVFWQEGGRLHWCAVYSLVV